MVVGLTRLVRGKLYNNANRLKTVSNAGTVRGTYTYNGFEQLIKRVITNSGSDNGTVVTVHDVFGNVIAELDAAGATVREYIWLPEAQIAPTMGGMADVDRPIAVVSGVNTASPQLLMVHVDHLNRPAKMTNGTGSVVWSAVWLPWGGTHSVTGAEVLNSRFPGQWFQLEAGLHYNWHRHFDPTLGRFTQPDPLGLVDGPSVFAYGLNRPIFLVDQDGRLVGFVFGDGTAISGGGVTASAGKGKNIITGTSNSFTSVGAGVGLDIGVSGGFGVFFGDWCQFSGRGGSISLTAGPITIKLFASGGRPGFAIGLASGPKTLPGGVSASVVNTTIKTNAR